MSAVPDKDLDDALLEAMDRGQEWIAGHVHHDRPAFLAALRENGFDVVPINDDRDFPLPHPLEEFWTRKGLERAAFGTVTIIEGEPPTHWDFDRFQEWRREMAELPVQEVRDRAALYHAKYEGAVQRYRVLFTVAVELLKSNFRAAT